MHDDAWSTDSTAEPSHVWDTPGARLRGADRERVCGDTAGRAASPVSACQGGTTAGGVASKAQLRWEGPAARISVGRAGMGT